MEDNVYVIGTPGSSIVKIGVTGNLKRRLRQIQLMSPAPLDILWSCAGSRPLEAALHRHFTSLRVHGEWFDFLERDPVSAVKEALPGLVVDAVEAAPRQAITRASGKTPAAKDHRAKYMPQDRPGLLFALDPTGTKVEG